MISSVCSYCNHRVNSPASVVPPDWLNVSVSVIGGPAGTTPVRIATQTIDVRPASIIVTSSFAPIGITKATSVQKNKAVNHAHQ